MSKIAVVGSGRVGAAVAKLTLVCTDFEVVLIDSNEEVLNKVFEECSELPRSQHQMLENPAVPISSFTAASRDQIEAILKSEKVDVVVCCTPFQMNIDVATAAAKAGCHYLDFTEDNGVAAQVRSLGPSRITFVPQTGLAPGLVSYIGLSLFEELGEPKSLSLRVGALPQVSFGPAHYSITWSPEGLINEYLKPALRKVDNVVEEVPSLDDEETVIAHGQVYEAFTTSGGAGDLSAYSEIPSVEYKTLRYPGHLSFIHKLLSKVDYDFEEGVELAKSQFNTTRDDVVILIAEAVDTTGKSASAGLRFYPSVDLNLTALELTTAGTGVAVVELILGDKLPAGVLNCSQIPMSELSQTNSLQFVFEHLQ